MSLRSKWRGYGAAFRVEQHRADAVLLRQSDPASYQKILEMAEGEAADAARKDPDAFVAIFLSYADEAGRSAPNWQA